MLERQRGLIRGAGNEKVTVAFWVFRVLRNRFPALSLSADARDRSTFVFTPPTYVRDSAGVNVVSTVPFMPTSAFRRGAAGGCTWRRRQRRYRRRALAFVNVR